MKAPAPPPTPTLFVVSTSHMDWDWAQTFETYYSKGNNGVTPPVRTILDDAIALLGDATLSPPYWYNLAEIAWLQRYMDDNPDLPAKLASIPDVQTRFVFLGGGITSPDNLVCNGEAFIRNYLVGRAFVKGVGLGGHLRNVCWIPDDFGHDPQLPVVISAMGMKGVSFWRVPGNEPKNNDGTPNPKWQPIDGSLPLSKQLAKDGVTFHWLAADGSSALAQQMSGGYGVVWNQATSGDGAQEAAMLESFVKAGVTWPGALYMAPCGGDFSTPSSNLVDAVNDFDSPGVTAVMGTFDDYIDAVRSFEASGGVVTRRPMDASNFWTGFFASHPQLKVDHQRSTNNLMAAEVLSTLLHAGGAIPSSALGALETGIAAAWQTLLPSTHHDYVTGTSPQPVYDKEQRPRLELAVQQSEQVLSQAASLLGGAVRADGAGGTAYVVANPLGIARKVGALVEIPMTPDLEGVVSVDRGDGTGRIAVQVTKDRKILFPYLGLSMSYGTVLFSREPGREPPPPMACLVPPGEGLVTFGNGVVQISVSQADAWAIRSMRDVKDGCREIFANGKLGNAVKLYYETLQSDTATALGNLYQMGVEQNPTYKSSGPKANEDGFFAGPAFASVGEGELLENGPYRWHFRGTIQNVIPDPNNPSANLTTTLTVEYFLEHGEPLCRVRITGNAPMNASGNPASSIVTVWDIDDGSGMPAKGMCYGTGNHWNSDVTAPYWKGPVFVPYGTGPTFRPVHDYCALVAGDVESALPVSAVYNEGMRAWAFYEGQLFGVLFRNADGGQRGASGTDGATHVQSFAFRLPGVGAPDTCQPLAEAMCFQVRQCAAPVGPQGAAGTMPGRGSLASLSTDRAILRVARMQASAAVPDAPRSFVLRVYQPTNEPMATMDVSVPAVAASPRAQVSLVTALEEPLEGVIPPRVERGVVTLAGVGTLTTLRVELPSTIDTASRSS